MYVYVVNECDDPYVYCEQEMRIERKLSVNIDESDTAKIICLNIDESDSAKIICLNNRRRLHQQKLTRQMTG